MHVSSASKNQTDEIIQSHNEQISLFIRIFIISILGCSLLPYFIVVPPSMEQNTWVYLNGIGIKANLSFSIVSPTLFTFFLLKLYLCFKTLRIRWDKPEWNSLQYIWMFIIMELFFLFYKRQHTIIQFQEQEIIITTAQVQTVPHPSVGYLLEFFLILLLFAIAIKQILDSRSSILTKNTNFSKIIQYSSILFLFPWFSEPSSTQIRSLLGIGYGFAIEQGAYLHGSSLEEWIYQIFQILCLFLLFSNKISPRAQFIIESLFLGIHIAYLTRVAHMVFVIYKRGAQVLMALPPITPYF